MSQQVKQSQHKYPTHIDWEVTSFCNHSCLYCYNAWRKEDDKKQDYINALSKSTNEYMNIAVKIYNAHPVSVTITGGEPLSIFDKLKQAIMFLVRHKIFVSINTNCTLITPAIADFCNKYNVALLISLPCADEKICDSLTQIQGSFKRIEKGLNIVKQYRIPTSVNMVVSKLNINNIFETAKYVHDNYNNFSMGITKVSLPCYTDTKLKDIAIGHDDFEYMLKETIRARKELGMNIDSLYEYSLCGFTDDEIIRQFAFKRTCNAGKGTLCIGADGGIKPCPVNEESYGNINTDDILDIFHNGMNCWKDNEYLPEDCKDCKNLRYCGGGCRLDAKNTYGDIKRPDTTAKIENKDFDYERYFNELHKYEHEDLDRKYIISENIQLVEEDTVVRVAQNTRCAYVDKYAFAKLVLLKEFSINDVQEQTGYNIDYCTQLIVNLRSIQIIK